MTTLEFKNVDPVWLACDNCGNDCAFEGDSDGLFYPDDEVTCETCGATSMISVDPDDGIAYAALQYCRHNRSFEENCIRCEIEGIDIP